MNSISNHTAGFKPTSPKPPIPQTLAVSLLGHCDTATLQSFDTLVSDSGSSIFSAHVMRLDQFTGMLYSIGGAWNTLGKLQAALPKFADQHHLQLGMQLSEPLRAPNNSDHHGNSHDSQGSQGSQDASDITDSDSGSLHSAPVQATPVQAAPVQAAPQPVKHDADANSIQDRSSPDNQATLAYGIEIIAIRSPSLLQAVSKFCQRRGIQITDLSISPYVTSHSNTIMSALHASILVPSRQPIAALRDDFMDFADSMNFDAVIEPLKH